MIGPVDPEAFQRVVDDAVGNALREDLDERGDVTAALVGEEAIGTLRIVGREPGVVAGSACAIAAFQQVDSSLVIDWRSHDGMVIERGSVIAEIRGSFRSILTAERTALNFLGHLSGVATTTARFVDLVTKANPHCVVLDTRKTTPLLRILEKAAVVAGGGVNHRFGLSDAILIKDNHLGAMSITEGIERSRALHPSLAIEVECDSTDQALEAVAAGAEAVLLDNMDAATVARAVEAIRAAGGTATRIEVSGGVTLNTAGDLAAAGADCISVGALTHSSVVIDFGLDLVRETPTN
ncbi:MAG: carboxylating nicotinate-nucleotide diphosphorylase [Actinomycetota bacterium]